MISQSYIRESNDRERQRKIMTISFFLIDTSTGESMTNDTADYAKDGDHFWNLMIRTDDGHEKENLIQESVLYFDSEEQARAFINGAKEKKKISCELLGEGKVKVFY